MSGQRQFMAQKPPKAPHPPCVECGRPMANVRMLGHTRVGTHTKVDCLALCGNPTCKAEHKGERIIDLTNNRNRFISQRFALFSVEMAKLRGEVPTEASNVVPLHAEATIEQTPRVDTESVVQGAAPVVDPTALLPGATTDVDSASADRVVELVAVAKQRRKSSMQWRWKVAIGSAMAALASAAALYSSVG